MKKYLILSLIAIVLAAYGGAQGKVVKEKTSVSYSIQASVIDAGYATVNIPQARAKEMSIGEIRFKTYGPEVLLAQRRLNRQDRSNRLWINADGRTVYKPIAKEFSKPVISSPPKIC